MKSAKKKKNYWKNSAVVSFFVVWGILYMQETFLLIIPIQRSSWFSENVNCSWLVQQHRKEMRPWREYRVPLFEGYNSRFALPTHWGVPIHTNAFTAKWHLLQHALCCLGLFFLHNPFRASLCGTASILFCVMLQKSQLYFSCKMFISGDDERDRKSTA